MTSAPKSQPNTLAEKKQQGERIAALTAYDYATAAPGRRGRMDVILVGDSLAQAMLGYDNTLPVTVEEMIHHTKAVRRAVNGLS